MSKTWVKNYSLALMAIAAASVGALPQTSLAGGLGDLGRAAAHGADDAARAARTARIMEWARGEGYTRYVALSAELKEARAAGNAEKLSALAAELEEVTFKFLSATPSPAFKRVLDGGKLDKIEYARHTEMPYEPQISQMTRLLDEDRVLANFNLADDEIRALAEKLNHFDYDGMSANDVVSAHLYATLLTRASKQGGYTLSFSKGIPHQMFEGFMLELNGITGSRRVNYDKALMAIYPPQYNFEVTVLTAQEAQALLEFMAKNEIEFSAMKPVLLADEAGSSSAAVRAAKQAELQRQVQEAEQKVAELKRKLERERRR